MSRSILLLLILALSAKTLSASSPSTEPKVGQNINSRWLTYACNSKGQGDRNRTLLRRILTQPCNSEPKGSTANDLYNDNTTRGSNTFVNVTLGIVAGVSMLLGFLFITDRDTFAQVTGVKELPYYCKCSKPRIDGDEDDASEPTPFEKDTYHLTEETQDYLAEEEEAPKQQLRSIFWCLFQTKEYDDNDKYNVPKVESEAEGGNVDGFLSFWEDVRLRFCWRPAKKYRQKDKYDVDLKEMRSEGGRYAPGEDEIRYAPSSYESAEPGAAPW